MAELSRAVGLAAGVCWVQFCARSAVGIERHAHSMAPAIRKAITRATLDGLIGAPPRRRHTRPDHGRESTQKLQKFALLEPRFIPVYTCSGHLDQFGLRIIPGLENARAIPY